MKLRGKIVEVGSLVDTHGRGIRMESSAGMLDIIGLTIDECRAAAQWYGRDVEITIDRAEHDYVGA